MKIKNKPLLDYVYNQVSHSKIIRCSSGMAL